MNFNKIVLEIKVGDGEVYKVAAEPKNVKSSKKGFTQLKNGGLNIGDKFYEITSKHALDSGNNLISIKRATSLNAIIKGKGDPESVEVSKMSYDTFRDQKNVKEGVYDKPRKYTLQPTEQDLDLSSKNSSSRSSGNQIPAGPRPLPPSGPLPPPPRQVPGEDYKPLPRDKQRDISNWVKETGPKEEEALPSMDPFPDHRGEDDDGKDPVE